MKVSALYYATGLASDTPVPISVRVAYQVKPVGNDPGGTDYRFAQMQERIPRLIFMVEEKRPTSKAVVSISADEVYQVNAVQPVDLISVSALVVSLGAAKAATYEYPGSLAWPASLWS